MQDQPSADHWKYQYRQLLNEFASKEREWETLESALRRAGSQLAVAAMGRSQALDDTLGELRVFLQEGTATNDVSDSLSRLKSALRTTDLEPTPSTSPSKLDEEMRGLLGQLIERMSGVPALKDSTRDLAWRLESGDTDWSQFFVDLAGGVVQMISSLQTKKSELETFLEQVNDQLAEFDTWTRWQSKAAKNRQQETLDLESSVKTQIAGLQSEMAEETDLAVLKLKVQTQLNVVAERMRLYREGEDRRQSEANLQNAMLEAELQKLRQKAKTLADRVELQQRLDTDALTGVHSRFAYDRRVQEEYRRWKRDMDQPLTLSLWDIDGFKAVNDALGHGAGDRVLHLVGELMNQAKRADDFVARVGGEEFVILFPGTDAYSAMVIANRLRKTIADSPLRGIPETVTVSCGVTQFRQGDTPLAVYKRADQALFKAKKSGRNRCEAL
ncbi:MAG: diguanylate cyclase [Xanthomonadales bacterium]|nr:diguanylate cyclase [Xanthomonadales bacterium]